MEPTGVPVGGACDFVWWRLTLSHSRWQLIPLPRQTHWAPRSGLTGTASRISQTFTRTHSIPNLGCESLKTETTSYTPVLEWRTGTSIKSGRLTEKSIKSSHPAICDPGIFYREKATPNSNLEPHPLVAMAWVSVRSRAEVEGTIPGVRLGCNHGSVNCQLCDFGHVT